MNLSPFEAPSRAAWSESATTANPVQQKDLLLSVLSTALHVSNSQEFDIYNSVGTTSMIVSSTHNKYRSSRRRLKRAVRDTLSKEATRVDEMKRMTVIAMSRLSDDDMSHDCYSQIKVMSKGNVPQGANFNPTDFTPLTGGVDLLSGRITAADRCKISKEGVPTEPYTTPMLRDGCTKLSAPPPPSRQASSISWEEGEISAKDLTASVSLPPTYYEPETTPEGYNFRCQARYTSPWLLKLKPQPECVEVHEQVSPTTQEVAKLKPLGSGLTRSPSKGGLIRNRLSSMSKLAPSRSTIFSTATKRFNKSFNSALPSKVGICNLLDEDNCPQANATWDAIPSVKSPPSRILQEQQASFYSTQKINAPAATAFFKLRSSLKEGSSEETGMLRINKSLGNLSLGRKVTASEGKESPGANAAWENMKQPKMTRSHSRSSYGNLRGKKISPAGLTCTDPSPNAAWGAM